MLGKLFGKPASVQEARLPVLPEVPAEELRPDSTLPASMDSFLDLMPELLWMCEGKDITDSIILWISSAAPLGLPRGSGDTSTLSALCSLVHDGDKSHFRQLLRNAQTHPSPGTKNECRIMTAGGSYEWFKVAVKRERSVDGNSQRLVGTLLNISNDKTHESEYDIVMTRSNLSREMLNDGLWNLQIINGDALHLNNVFGGLHSSENCSDLRRLNNFLM